MTFIEWLMLLPVLLALSVVPGPNNFTATFNGMRAGVVKATLATTGRNLAFAILMLVSALGLGVVILNSALMFSAIKWVGVAYLVYLAIVSWRSQPEELMEKVNAPVGTSVRLYPMMRQEFLIAISNPKAILLFTAIFPQFIDPNEQVMTQFAIIGASFLVTEYVAAMMYASGGKQIRRFVSTVKRAKRINQATASLFVGTAGLLASSSR